MRLQSFIVFLLVAAAAAATFALSSTHKKRFSPHFSDLVRRERAESVFNQAQSGKKSYAHRAINQIKACVNGVRNIVVKSRKMRDRKEIGFTWEEYI